MCPYIYTLRVSKLSQESPHVACSVNVLGGISSPPLCFATTAEVSVDCSVEWSRAKNVGLNAILNECMLYVA